MADVVELFKRFVNLEEVDEDLRTSINSTLKRMGRSLSTDGPNYFIINKICARFTEEFNKAISDFNFSEKFVFGWERYIKSSVSYDNNKSHIHEGVNSGHGYLHKYDFILLSKDTPAAHNHLTFSIYCNDYYDDAGCNIFLCMTLLDNSYDNDLLYKGSKVKNDLTLGGFRYTRDSVPIRFEQYLTIELFYKNIPEIVNDILCTFNIARSDIRPEKKYE
jgi:hypothetical protein